MIIGSLGYYDFEGLSWITLTAIEGCREAKPCATSRMACTNCSRVASLSVSCGSGLYRLKDAVTLGKASNLPPRYLFETRELLQILLEPQFGHQPRAIKYSLFNSHPSVWLQ